ncbi:hypothetical protein ACCS75_36570, partial [Rhizobium ruizarguesonis]
VGLNATIRHVVFKGDRYLGEAEVSGDILRFMADNPLSPGAKVGLVDYQDRAFITRIDRWLRYFTGHISRCQTHLF